MSSKDNFWIEGVGGISWVEDIDRFMMILGFTSENSIKRIDKKIKGMDKSKMIVTVVEEYEMYYTIIFYEDPEEKIETKFEFLVYEIELQGEYSKFKEKYDPSKKIYFTYEKFDQDITELVGKITLPHPLIQPFQVKKFRIIKESDLRLDEFKQQSTTPGFIPDGFEYYNEAMIMLKGNSDKENLV